MKVETLEKENQTMTRCARIYFGLLMILCLVVVPSARADGDLDQSFSINPNDGSGAASFLFVENSLAQTFTVGHDGLLACIEIYVQRLDPLAGPLILEVQSTTSGEPDGTVLASVSMDPDDIPTTYSYVNFDLTVPNPSVRRGDVLAIVLRTEVDTALYPPYVFEGEYGARATYSGGELLLRAGGGPWDPTGQDYGFRTYVAADADGDGLSDADELALGTDPNDPDTDHDGLSDFTEVDTAVNGCPDPLNPDSDGDTLLDGDEVALGTSPCSTDTDGDGIPDQVDPDPVIPGEFDSELQAVTLVVALGIQATDLSLFNGPNANANAGRRNSLANRCSSAARKIGDGDFDAAIALLEGVLAKIDGDESEPDWMDASDEKAALAADVNLLISLLM